MIRNYFINKVEDAVEKAISAGKLGEMTEFTRGSFVAERPKNSDFGDYAVNISSLARVARISPQQIANAIVEQISDNNNNYSVIGGFINFKAGHALLANLVEEIFKNPKEFGKPHGIKAEKILLEYVSANPTGPFHIGHGRWAAMGSVLANLLKFYGHDVFQEFYINDAGSQITKLANSLAIRVRQELGEDIDFPADEIERKNFYPGEYLIPVAIKFANKKFGYDPANPKACVLPTDWKKELNTAELADFAKEEMEKMQKRLLEAFGVHFDNFYSELALHKSGKVEECVNKLKTSGNIYEKDGADWFKSSAYGDDQDRVIKKADSSNTYLTADIAYHIDKLERGFDRLINIWGADHHGYVARVKASIEALGYDPNRLEVLLGQLVNLVIDGNEVRMGKRKNMVTLDDLIDEVGEDATRFWMTMRNIDTTLDFDIELAQKNTDENPVFYVQYAHARACSILRNIVTKRDDGQAPMSEEELNELIARFTAENVLPAIDGARELILKLEEWKSVVKTSAETRQVYTICRYVQELASEFHSFYNANRVISEDKDLMKARVALVWCAKTVLSNVLENILAITAPERM